MRSTPASPEPVSFQADQRRKDVSGSPYIAVTLARLDRFLGEAGFDTVARRDEYFFQPLLVAINPPVRQ